MKFCIVGGDKRFYYLKKLLENDGFEVSAYCCRAIDDSETDIDKALAGSNVILGPIPFSRSKKTLALNDCNEIELKTFFSKLPHGCIFFGGAISSEIHEFTDNISIYDYFSFEDVAVRNAVPTAEGAIQTAIAESDRTIFESRTLVIGCGRCGKALALMLKGMGAKVTMTCRKPADHAIIKGMSVKAAYFDTLPEIIKNYDFIFNTVPALILDKLMLEKTDKDSLIIDIAQAPGGVDYTYASEHGIKALYCPGLPGRTAPYTAAVILKDAIVRTALSHF